MVEYIKNARNMSSAIDFSMDYVLDTHHLAPAYIRSPMANPDCIGSFLIVAEVDGMSTDPEIQVLTMCSWNWG